MPRSVLTVSSVGLGRHIISGKHKLSRETSEESMVRSTVVSIGETLWDVLPTGEFIGGAPFNVAAHMARLGARTFLVSRVGSDLRGSNALAAAEAVGIDTRLIQIDETHPTGVALAELDATGSARYHFPTPAAWEYIAAPAGALRVVSEADAVVYGALSQRCEHARPALRSLIEASRWRVFDPNLRPPSVDEQVLMWGLAHANVVKLNETECDVVANILGTSSEPEALRSGLARYCGVQSLCITQGEQGSLMYHAGSWHMQPVVPATVVDTVGAGDAFLAMLVIALLRGESTAAALERASRLAALVVSRAGAVPMYDPAAFI
jgi:fructokinase